MEIEDIVADELVLLFVGFNPSTRSAQTGHHYAGPGNQFWRLLAASGLTPRTLAPSEDRLLTNWGIGSTNLVARPTRGSTDLAPGELRSGIPRLRQLVTRTEPELIAYAGKGVYLAAAGRSNAPWGLQENRLFPPARDVIVPSPSARVRMSFEEKLGHYRELAELLAASGKRTTPRP